jgi:hypothetical protein
MNTRAPLELWTVRVVCVRLLRLHMSGKLHAAVSYAQTYSYIRMCYKYGIYKNACVITLLLHTDTCSYICCYIVTALYILNAFVYIYVHVCSNLLLHQAVDCYSYYTVTTRVTYSRQRPTQCVLLTLYYRKLSDLQLTNNLLSRAH